MTKYTSSKLLLCNTSLKYDKYNKTIIKIVFVCQHIYLPKKKCIDSDVYIEFLKKNYVFTEIHIPKTKFGSGFCHSVSISAAISEDKDIKQLS